MTSNEKILTENISVSCLSDPVTAQTSQELCHDRYELLYVISGRGRYISEGFELPISSGSLFISKPFEYRSMALTADEPFSRYIITFSDSLLPPPLLDRLSRIFGGVGTAYYPPESCLSEIRSVFDRLYVARLVGESEREIFVSALISEIIALLSSIGERNHAPRYENLATRVGGYINSNLRADLGLDELAKRFFVNKYYLCRTFKSQSGVSIHSYINTKRVLYAKSLMESGESAAAAAERSGFGDYSAFYRAYMKIYGTPPTTRSVHRSLS